MMMTKVEFIDLNSLINPGGVMKDCMCLSRHTVVSVILWTLLPRTHFCFYESSVFCVLFPFQKQVSDLASWWFSVCVNCVSLLLITYVTTKLNFVTVPTSLNILNPGN